MMNFTQKTTIFLLLALSGVPSLTAASKVLPEVAAFNKVLEEVWFSMVAPVASVTDRRITPLMEAAMSGNTDTIKRLLRARADANAIDSTGKTALIFAAMNGHLDAAGILIDRTKNIDHTDHLRMSALTYAAKNGFEELTHTLATKKANPNIPDINGKTAREYAEEHRDAELAKRTRLAKAKAFIKHAHTVKRQVEEKMRQEREAAAQADDIPVFLCPQCGTGTTDIDERKRMTRCKSCHEKSETEKFMQKL